MNTSSELEEYKRVYTEIAEKAFPLLERLHTDKVKQIYVEQATANITVLCNHPTLTEEQKAIIDAAAEVIKDPSFLNCRKFEMAILLEEASRKGLTTVEIYKPAISELIDRVNPILKATGKL